MINCVNCHQSIKQVALNWYQPECQLIKELISNEDLVSIIMSFLYHLDGHRVFYTRKHRTKPDHLEYDSDSEISGYYESKNIKICTLCFQKALKRSLENQHRLPYLRTDIGYFLMISYNYSITESQEIKKKFLKHYFPSLYFCEFYRQSQPKEIDSFFYIRKLH